MITKGKKSKAILHLTGKKKRSISYKFKKNRIFYLRKSLELTRNTVHLGMKTITSEVKVQNSITSLYLNRPIKIRSQY